MALPTSGQISLNDIRIELGIPSQSPFELKDAIDGVYVSLNTGSTLKPTDAGDYKITNWYGYCHTCSPIPGNNSVLLGNSIHSICDDPPVSVWTVDGTLSLGNIIYTDSTLTTPVTGYIRAYIVSIHTMYSIDDLTGEITNINTSLYLCS